MDIRKCDNCHHEWEGDYEHCAWCDSEFSTKIGETPQWSPYDHIEHIQAIIDSHGGNEDVEEN